MSVFGYTFGRVPDGLLFSDASDRAKVLYAVLTRWADLRPNDHPTRGELAAALGCSVDSMDRAKDELQEHRYLDVQPRYIDGTKVRDANDWHLLPGPATQGDPLPGGSRSRAATVTSIDGKAAGNGGRTRAAGGSRSRAATLDRTENLEKENTPTAPDGDQAKNGQSDNAGSIVADWIKAQAARPDDKTVGMVAQAVGKALKRHVPADAVRAGLAHMSARGLDASMATRCIDAAAAKQSPDLQRASRAAHLTALKADASDRLPFGASYTPDQAAAILGGTG